MRFALSSSPNGMIVVTALRHNLIVATRNTRDFSKAGVKVVDPFFS